MSEENPGQPSQGQGGQEGGQGQKPQGGQGQGQGQQRQNNPQNNNNNRQNQGGGGHGGGHGGGGGGGRHGRHRRRFRHGGGGGGGHPQHQHQQHRQGGGGQQHQQQRQQRVSPQGPERSEMEKAFMLKTALDPFEWIQLEKGSNDPSMRALDMIAPIGKGQRGLIVSPPKAGKTTFLKQISNAVAGANPEIKQYVLLIDERPEEVTDFKRSVPAEVVASSSDQPYEAHVRCAEGMMKRALEEASSGKDVFILLDSLTRLARVYNQFAVGSRTMSGGLDSRAMEIPRRFFGSARKIEEGGSLTILASILVDTGSKMDEVIFQEFKGTGNMELVLYRQAAEMRMFPAIKLRDSGTRKEEKLLPKEYLEAVYKLRRHIAAYGDLDALKWFTENLRVYKTNKAFLATLR